MKNLIQTLILCLLLANASSAQSDFTLGEAVNYAIENSDQIKMDQLDFLDAKESVREYKAIGIPQINGSVDYQYNIIKNKQAISDFISPAVYQVLFSEQILEQRELGPPSSFEATFVTSHFLSSGLEASSLLFDGSYLVGLKAARLYEDLTKKSIAVTEQEIRAIITKAYLAALIIDEHIEILDKNIQTISKMRNDTEAYYTEGFVEQIDVDRLNLSLQNLLNERDKLNQSKELSLNLLKFQMNYPLSQNINLTENLDQIIALFQLYNFELSSEIDFNDRAEYDQIQTSQSLNEMDLDRIKKGYLPSVKARAGLSASLQRDDLFDNNQAGIIPTSFVALGVDIPIFDGNKRSAQLQRKKILIEKTDIEKERFEKSVVLQVSNARLAFRNALKNLDNTEKSLALTEDIYNKAVIKYNEGVGSSIEVNQAESAMLQEQSKYISSLYDLILSKTEIDIALGKL